MKQGLTIVGIILLAYGAFSTYFHDTTLVGNIGRAIGQKNLALFGYLAYVDFLLLFYPLVRFYRHPTLLRRLDGYVGWLLFFLSFVVLQPLLVGTAKSGLLGRELYSALMPFIGKAGLWLFWLMVFLLSLTLVLEEEWKFEGFWRTVRERVRGFFHFPKKRTRQAERLKSSSDWDLSSLYVSFKRIFRNPFDHEAEKEMERILSMELTPIEEAEERKTSDKGQKSITISQREKRPEKSREAVGDILRYEASKKKNPKKVRGEKFRRSTEEPKEIVNAFEPRRHSSPSNYADTEKEIMEQKPLKREEIRTEEMSESPIPAEATSRQKLRRPKSETAVQESKKMKRVEIVEELEENSKLLADIETGKREKPKNFKLPKIDFLTKPPRVPHKINEAEIDRKIGELLDKLERFKIEGDVVRTYTGPLVTTFEFKPAPNVKVSKILGLQDDLAMALSAETIRIQAPIPGRDVVGIEIPNETPSTIYLREILESDLFQKAKSPLTVALGKDIVGNPFVTDLKKLPHLLIAGTTGSGKSVGINAMLLSLLYRNDPDRLKLILIDPKMLEFSIYNDIPHLLTPVIIEPKKAISALANMVAEMERRYKLMSEVRVKNIDNYNEKARKEGWEEMPFIVIVIDELADLMMNGGKEVEYSIARLAQMARAAGIHLIIATQRPSVDVVTGLIKANLPSRLSYRVGQRIDSKVILDQMGAESLLGRGDALFTPPGATGLVRLHAPWNSEEEIEEIVEFLKAQREPEYDESYLVEGGGASSASGGEEEIELDPLFEQAKEIILTDKKTSISYLQRRLQIGYNRSANLIDQLTQQGILSAPNAKGQREILV